MNMLQNVAQRYAVIQRTLSFKKADASFLNIQSL